MPRTAVDDSATRVHARRGALGVVVVAVLATGLVAVSDSRDAPARKPPPISSRYIEVGDGVRLAAQVWLPRAARNGARLPAMLRMTRYPLPVPGEPGPETDLVGRGFAAVVANVEGAGPSFGT